MSTADKERERFEAWASQGINLTLRRGHVIDGSDFSCFSTHAAWLAWQAASQGRAELVEALQALMELERRGRLMPIGREWDAARAAIAKHGA